MPIKHLFLPSIFLALCGCQPGTTEQAANSSVSSVSHESTASAKSSVTPPPALSTRTTDTSKNTNKIALAKKNNCLTCHSIDKKVVGPAWKEVAAKYRGDVTAEDFLTRKIAQGGRGVWGSMPMPADPNINETDRRNLARFVLNLK